MPEQRPHQSPAHHADARSAGAGDRLGSGGTGTPDAEWSRAEVFVVIPAFNEEEKIAEVLDDLTAHYPNVVVVDDGSRDQTAKAARPHARYVLRHLINRGQGAALQTGIEYALRRGARFVVTFDADGQHDPNDIPALIGPLASGEADVSLGSRFLGKAEGMKASRRAVLRAAVVFSNTVSGVKLSDAHNGLRAFTADAARKIDISADGMAHASQIIDQIGASGVRVREVPVTIRYTEYSMAKGQPSSRMFRIAMQYFLNRFLS